MTAVDERFERLSVIGRGAVGVVYRARDRVDGTEVALKTLPQLSALERQELKREFRLACDLVHPNLASLYELFETSGDCFFTMELVQGVPFTDFVKPGIAPETLSAVLSQLVSAIAALHQGGLLHRDIKPTNVLVTANGRVVLLDFGLSRPIAERLPAPEFAGTLAYMSPEQIWGQATGMSDWYSLGVLAYEALTGRLPREPEDWADVASWRSVKASELPSHLPSQLREAIASLLSVDPRERCDQATLELFFSSARPSVVVPRFGGGQLIGRDAELLDLQRAFDGSRGTRAVYELCGESGCGKTALAQRFVTTVSESNSAVVLAGQCRLRETVPYQAIDEVVAGLALLWRPEADAWDPLDMNALVQLFPAFGYRSGAASEEEPHKIRQRAARMMAAILSEVSSRQHLVIWIDDTQWGDLESAALVRHLMSGTNAPPIFWLFTARPERNSAEWADLSTSPESGVGATHRAQLRPLGQTAAQALLDDLLHRNGARLREEAKARIAAECEGSPLLLQQIAQLIRQRRTPAAAFDSNHGIDVLVTSRLALLSDEELRLLQLAALSERPINRSVLLRAATFPGSAAALNRLCSTHLLRVEGAEQVLNVSVHHERIRDCVRSQIDAVQAVTAHRRLAESLLDLQPDEHYSLFFHSIEAGDETTARFHGLLAAEQASSKLAFKLAADIYERLLAVVHDVSLQQALQAQLGVALQNAGHSARAAGVFLALSALGDSNSAIWRQRSAEQYLIGGEMRRGMEVLKAAFATVNLPFPEERSLLTATLSELVRAWLARRSKQPLSADSDDALRVGLLLSAAKGLAVVNPAFYAYFSLLALRLSAGVPDPEQNALAMILAGMVLESVGGPLGKWGSKLLEEAESSISAMGSGKLAGCLNVCHAQALLNKGIWQHADDRCRRAEELLRSSKEGHTWEKNLIEMASIRCAEELGALKVAVSRSESWRDDAEARGDLYASVTAQLFLAFVRIARDDPDGAQQASALALRPWPGTIAPFHEFYRLRVDAYAHLYRGELARASALVVEAEAVAHRARLLQLPLVRTDFLLLLARTRLLEVASGSKAQVTRLPTYFKRLDAEKRPDALGHAALLRAGYSALKHQGAVAKRELDAAVRHFSSRDMKLGVAYAQACLGTLDQNGGVLASEAVTRLKDGGISSPQNWLKIHCPGLGHDLVTAK